MEFRAIISSRSSTNKAGPPSETEILRLNPQRREKILKFTEWDKLVEGTLNLEVQEDIVSRLKKRDPDIREPGSSVYYPPPYQDIPKKRKNYFYYKGTISKGGCREDVLFRAAEVPPRRGLLEAFAPVRLRDAFKLKDEDKVECVIQDLRRVESGDPGSL